MSKIDWKKVGKESMKPVDPGYLKYEEKRLNPTGENGKGDWRRPLNESKYRSNFDAIDWSK